MRQCPVRGFKRGADGRPDFNWNKMMGDAPQAAGATAQGPGYVAHQSVCGAQLGRQPSAPVGLAEMRTNEGTPAFATSPGQPTLDGPKGDYSPFTQALLDNITQPGVEIQQAMTQVRAQVHERTNNEQLPWGSSNLLSTVYLNPKPPGGK